MIPFSFLLLCFLLFSSRAATVWTSFTKWQKILTQNSDFKTVQFLLSSSRNVSISQALPQEGALSFTFLELQHFN